MKVKGFDIDEIKKRISASDELAFRELFNLYYARLLNYAFVIVKHHETAEDIVLEVLHSIWEQRARLKNIERFESYLYVCTKNKTLDIHRRNAKYALEVFDEPHYKELITHTNPENKLLSLELNDVLDKAILALPEKTRLVYRLIKEDGLKQNEVAELLGVSAKTVNNQVVSAMKKIRLTITSYLSGEDKNPKFIVLRNILLSLF